MTGTPRMAAVAALLCIAPAARGAALVPDPATAVPQVETRSVQINGLPMRVQTAGWHHRARGQDLVTRDGGELAALRQPTVPVARLVAGRHEAMPPGIDMPFDERAFWHGVLRHSLGRFAESLPASPYATLTVAAHAGHYIMGDDPALVIDAIRRVSEAAAAARGRGQ